MTWQPLISPIPLALFVAVGLGLSVFSLFRRPRTTAWVSSLRRVLMVLVLSVALAGPAIPVEQENVVSNVEIVLAIDRTGSMAAEDGPDGAPRLEAVKRDLTGLIEGAASARFAVVTWDSSSRVELPLTTDTSAVMNLVETLHQEVSEFSTGSTLARPAQTVYELLERSAEERPQNRRYVVVLSDGESTEGSANAQGVTDLSAWAGVSELIDGGAVFGYGTEEGGPMQVYGVAGSSQSGDYMLDASGAVAISKLNAENLRQLAEALDVDLTLNPSEDQARALGESFVADATTQLEERPKSYTYSYLTWIPALVLGVLLAWEAGVLSARVVALRRSRAL